MTGAPWGSMLSPTAPLSVDGKHTATWTHTYCVNTACATRSPPAATACSQADVRQGTQMAMLTQKCIKISATGRRSYMFTSVKSYSVPLCVCVRVCFARTLGLHIKSIEENSRAKREGLFKEDECIVQINDTPLQDKTFAQSV